MLLVQNRILFLPGPFACSRSVNDQRLRWLEFFMGSENFHVLINARNLLPQIQKLSEPPFSNFLHNRTFPQTAYLRMQKQATQQGPARAQCVKWPALTNMCGLLQSLAFKVRHCPSSPTQTAILNLAL